MTTLSPMTRDGNRGNVPNLPPYKYDDNTWLKQFVGPLQRSLSIYKARLLLNLTAGRLFGPMELPCVPGNAAIVGVYAHPFIWGDVDTSQQHPTAGDSYVVRPVFAIRGRDEIEVQCAMMDLSTANELTGNTGVDPLIEDISMERMVGDFFVSETLSGAPAESQVNPATIMHVRNDGADPDNLTTHTIYTLALNMGVSKRVSIANTEAAPVVGDTYPTTYDEDRYDYDVGQYQQEQDHIYPKRNMREVENLSPEVQGNADKTDQSNPFVVVAYRRVLDFPDNPTTYVKKVTLGDGSTVKVDDSYTVVVGEELGDPTTTGSLQTAHDVGQWAAFDAFLILAPDKEGDETLSGMAVDPWPLFVS